MIARSCFSLRPRRGPAPQRRTAVAPGGGGARRVAGPAPVDAATAGVGAGPAAVRPWAGRLRPLIAGVLLAAAGPVPVLAQAQVVPAVAADGPLQPAPARISDRAIALDQQVYEAAQARLKAINDGGRRLADGALAQAQCWLDVSFHEYTRNDRGAFPAEALAQSARLAAAMEQGATPDLTVPLVAGGLRLRPDLWARSAALRGHPGWSCAAARANCGEVELAHAGHEQRQLDWRHARPYVQIAEDLIGEAEALAAGCRPPAVPVAPAVSPPAVPVAEVPPPAVAVAPAVVPVPVVPPAPEAPRALAPPVQLQSAALFEFNRADAAALRPESVTALRLLAERVQAQGLSVRRLVLVGHADRLNGTGHGDYNQRLSERRAQTVRAVLADFGVQAAQVDLQAAGDGAQQVRCDAPGMSVQAVQTCLLPNRRVEVLVEAVPAAAR
ncbi:MAG: hypothetical protein RIQ53_715 [Pseudomonadota bacterium]